MSSTTQQNNDASDKYLQFRQHLIDTHGEFIQARQAVNAAYDRMNQVCPRTTFCERCARLHMHNRPCLNAEALLASILNEADAGAKAAKNVSKCIKMYHHCAKDPLNKNIVGGYHSDNISSEFY